MSKVFNKKRIESIKNIKIKKYFIYAIGEILIVIIGILLALYLNKLKEENINKKYISKVLNEVNAEAKKYIRKSVYFMEYNAKRDSLVHKILTDKVKRDDYNLLGTTHLNVLQTMVSFEFDNTPLENLNRRLDFLNKDEKKVYDLLTIIKTNQDSYEFISENAKEILNDYKKFQKQNHEWFYLIEDDSIATQKEFDYRLKSFEYKNFIRDYANYEIYYKISSYSFLQIASFLTHYRVINSQKKDKLKPKQIDSILTNLNLKKLLKINCDTVYKLDNQSYKLFKDYDLSNFVLNGSKDTIQIKNEDNQIVANLVPKAYSSVKASNGTNLKVFIKEKCVASYSTQINSYLFYE
jgi:hypothetical protein|tara:strand:- start:61 stop:1113 length:1053 start_codon:yes stop_codon:yes gene_type:complete